MFLFRAECQDSILAQFSELPAGASRLHFGSFRQNGTRCMPESLGEPGLRKRTPPTRSLFASFAGCRQDNSGQAWGTRASGLNVGLVGCQDRLDLEEAADLQRKRRPSLASLRWSQRPTGCWRTTARRKRPKPSCAAGAARGSGLQER